MSQLKQFVMEKLKGKWNINNRGYTEKDIEKVLTLAQSNFINKKEHEEIVNGYRKAMVNFEKKSYERAKVQFKEEVIKEIDKLMYGKEHISYMDYRLGIIDVKQIIEGKNK